MAKNQRGFGGFRGNQCKCETRKRENRETVSPDQQGYAKAFS
ncbi:hypothetical protein COLO4_27365 [Corchorus olitorius]|uniref:Uncharacterized protein n=1 Tax=Corchorus olitorius TaxID=93759 RepID=A0A1R3HS08_9ROSI|nr:hypothetical protein COLO4_27365 [Corchorus olitorius]